MINILQKHIKTTIAQYTQLFNIDTQNITANLNSNIITVADLDDGEWTLSGAVDGIASKGCINNTFDFVNGSVTTDNFLGNENTEMELVAQKVNVGTAIAREIVLEMIKDTKLGNFIVVYANTAQNTSQETPKTISESLNTKVTYTVGVVFKISIAQMEAIGCSNTDIVFIKSVLGVGKETGSLIKFESLKNRFFAGNDYVVEFEFSYEDILDLDDTIISRLQHFDSDINLTVK